MCIRDRKRRALILFYFVLGVDQLLKLGQYIYIQLTTYIVHNNLTQDVFLSIVPLNFKTIKVACNLFTMEFICLRKGFLINWDLLISSNQWEQTRHYYLLLYIIVPTRFNQQSGFQILNTSTPCFKHNIDNSFKSIYTIEITILIVTLLAKLTQYLWD